MSSSQIAYVYRLDCEGRVYIGSAKRSWIRINDHFRELRANKHPNKYLQHAFNKYGEQSFSSKVIACCKLEARWDTEQEWIDKLQACNRKFGFNVMHSAEQLLPSEAMSEVLKAYWANRRETDWDHFNKRFHSENVAKRPQVRKQLSDAKLKAWAELEYKAQMVAAHKEYAAKPEIRAKLSSQVKSAWADPVYREKQMAERKRRFADPEFRAKLSLAAKNRKRDKRTTHNEIV
ncbi:MAG TPA: hypothetical protein VFR24_27430 [Candidatus Angelobacter sp.]|nr:hypothetical protein [Candidatus Angelobacter sp.]